MSSDRTTVCLLLEVDPVGLVRRPDASFALGQYVNDRPYAATSFLSTAIAQVFGTALNGTLKSRPELATTPIPLEAVLDVLPVKGGEGFLRSLFEPLGYDIAVERHPLDEQYPEWGDSPYYRVVLRQATTLSALLNHLYVLIPVFDGKKHYFIGDDEITKLLAKGEGWLATHPARDEITRRYLGRRACLVREALFRLREDEPEPADEAEGDEAFTTVERNPNLNEQRIESVVKTLIASGAARVLDLGCGEGKLIRELMPHRQFTEIVGLDVTVRALEIAQRRLRLDRASEAQSARVKLLHGSLMYRDERLAGFDAAAVVEVIEHLDPPRLKAFERVVFEFAKPRCVIITTPNEEYNTVWATLPAGEFRHADHRFEWTRAEFQSWATGIASRFGYRVKIESIGPIHPEFGSPTQMGVFTHA